MRRIREIDAEENTVIVMQVENEIGLLGTDRDYSETDYSAFLRFTNCDLAVSYGPRMSAKPLGACLAFELTPEKFLLIGLNCTPQFHNKPGACAGIVEHDQHFFVVCKLHHITSFPDSFENLLCKIFWWCRV